MGPEYPRDWMWSEALAMLAKVDRLHREFFRPIGSTSRRPAWEPPVDILETGREVLVFVALPGVDGEQVDLGDATTIDRTKPHDLDVVVDRIVVREGVKGRLTDSVELALKLGDGTLLVDATDGSEPVVMSERLVSWEYGITLPPLAVVWFEPA